MAFAFTKFDPHAFLENATQKAPPAKAAKLAKATDRQQQALATLADSAGGHPYARIFAALCERYPDYVGTERWEQAITDARRFLDQWGERASALGWTARDLFGLHTPPPDLQRLVEAHGGYDKITSEAWAQFDNDTKWWKQIVRDGGLQTEEPHWLSRYDENGLVWLLSGQPVVALTETSAAIQTSGGARLVYRRAR
jgi:hypothetical protein